MTVEQEEYELVPLSPIRRMEKRMERIEKAGTGQDMMKELIDVVRTNQQIVDDMVKINSEIINKIADLTDSVNKMMAKVDEFMSRLEVEGEEPAEEAPQALMEVKEEPKPERPPEVDLRLDKMEKRINSLILSTLAKNKMMVPRPAQKRLA